MRTAFLYARVSTDEQVKHNASIRFQTEAIERYASEHGYRLVEPYFIDEGASGGSMDRPAMKRLLAALPGSKIAAILYYDESRWSRAKDGPLRRDEIRASGIRCVSVADGSGDSNEYEDGDVGEDVRGLLAQDHIRKLRKDTPPRMRAAVARGGRAVGGAAPFGYVRRWGEGEHRLDSWLVPDEALAPVVLRAFEMYGNEGASTRDVAAYLEPHRGRLMDMSNVSRMLRNQRYAGDNVIGKKRVKKRLHGTTTSYQKPDEWTVYRDHHAPIVPRELFERVQLRLATMGSARQRTRSQDSANPFPQGMVRCAKCGSVVEFHKSEKAGYATTYTYLCRRRRNRGVARDQVGCVGSIGLGELKAQVLAHIGLLFDGNVMRDMIAQYKPKADPEIARLGAEITKLKNRQERLLESLMDASNAQAAALYQARLEPLLADTASKENELCMRQAAQPKALNPAKVATDARSIKQALLKSDCATVRLVIGDVFSRIAVDLASAAERRNAYATLQAAKPTKYGRSTLAMDKARREAAEIASAIDLAPGPVFFTYTWGGPVLTSARHLIETGTADAVIDEVISIAR